MMLGSNPATDRTWKRLPSQSVGVELGVWKGVSSEKFLNRASKLYLVDSWSIKPYKDSDEFGNYTGYLKKYSKIVGSCNANDFQNYYDKIYRDVIKKFNRDMRVEIYRMTTDTFFLTVHKYLKVDWVYVDASHSYEGCLNDLRNSLNIIVKGGSIFGDDYNNRPGVTKAVNQFLKETGLKIDNFYKDQYEICIPLV